jgi:aerobic-type carbon monoxide dehydrogenase small subunit (CoxS/CutS family)
MSEVITFSFNGETIEGVRGQTIAAALIDRGQRVLRETRFKSAPRSIFCGIGICFDCIVTVNGITNQRSCLIEIAEGMKVEGK